VDGDERCGVAATYLVNVCVTSSHLYAFACGRLCTSLYKFSAFSYRPLRECAQCLLSDDGGAYHAQLAIPCALGRENRQLRESQCIAHMKLHYRHDRSNPSIAHVPILPFEIHLSNIEYTALPMFSHIHTFFHGVVCFSPSP
jgi:hypothetical protein